jgi:hypothetical protein
MLTLLAGPMADKPPETARVARSTWTTPPEVARSEREEPGYDAHTTAEDYRHEEERLDMRWSAHHEGQHGEPTHRRQSKESPLAANAPGDGDERLDAYSGEDSEGEDEQQQLVLVPA